MRLLLPSIHSRSARTVRNQTDLTSSGGRLAMIFAKVSSETSPLVPMWITTVLPSRPAERNPASTSTTSLPCRLSAASTKKPCASSCGLAPSITDSPIATGGRWSTGSVVVVVDDVDVVDAIEAVVSPVDVWPPPSTSVDEVGGGADVPARESGPAEAAARSHSTCPTHWLGARAMLTPAKPTTTSVTAATTAKRRRRLYTLAVRDRRGSRRLLLIRPSRIGSST